MLTDAWDNLCEILARESDAYTVYVYRLDANERPVKPFFLKCPAWSNLPDRLRDKYGGGAFRVMVRQGRIMVLSGTIRIEAPLKRQAERSRSVAGA